MSTYWHKSTRTRELQRLTDQAHQFVYLVAAIPLNRASFLGDTATYTKSGFTELGRRRPHLPHRPRPTPNKTASATRVYCITMLTA